MTYELNGKRDNLQMNKRKAREKDGGGGGGGGGGQGKRLMPVMFDVYMRRVGFSLGMLKRKRGQFGVVCF